MTEYSKIEAAATEITSETLNSLNIEQALSENKENLLKLGGVSGLIDQLHVNVETGLTPEQIVHYRTKFGSNEFPESPTDTYFMLLVDALSDTTLIILLVAAAISLILDSVQEGIERGWVEGGAIFIAVALVSNITAANNYVKALQFRSLEQSTADDERCSVFRSNQIDRVNPKELVVGDIIVLQAGDLIPADSIIIDNNVVYSNESSLTGEPDDRKKAREKDCFLLSSCLITEGEEVRAVVIGVGIRSQWGKIKAHLSIESVNTPLQDKLETMTEQIGYFGMASAFATFIALVISIWARHHGENVQHGFINAFILAVTIVVVAIPEGLPLAVAISLAYSMRKMKKDQCLIRVLAACETMGNATNICSDKTGTLTFNTMTVVEGWFGDIFYDMQKFKTLSLPDSILFCVIENCTINRTAYLITKNPDGKTLDKPLIIGNKTEGALILLAKQWGFEYDDIKRTIFDDRRDRVFAFNSTKKRSTCLIHRPDGSVRLYCKGASEVLLKDCTMYLGPDGYPCAMTPTKRAELESQIFQMAEKALRTLLLAHRDFATVNDLPSDWQDNPPDRGNLCCDSIVGIIDPLRPSVKEAVATAQRAGVVVRMVTGDNLTTASAIARQCGILYGDGIALEGPAFRRMTPKEVDAVLPRLQVLARSSPEDKLLLVTRLNGHTIPANREEWEARFATREGVSWETHKDLLMPGYREEWESTRPDGGQVVGVTGDGTNDAPALKAADVGLAMGLTGTKVACSAADIVLLDDDFKSIVKAILWGRAIYDNIRKFLQFQLTVNVVALSLVFIGAVAGFDEPPINAVQMLWVNLIMDTFGALALGTEAPTHQLLERRPYKRSSNLISKPMIRNISVMSMYQLTLLLVLLFKGPEYFNIIGGETCARYRVYTTKLDIWDVTTGQKLPAGASLTLPSYNYATCSDFKSLCDVHDQYCLQRTTVSKPNGPTFHFDDLDGFSDQCLLCEKHAFVHGTIIFNAFIFLQIFNEYTSKSIGSDWYVFKGFFTNYTFMLVTIFTVGAQIFLVEKGGEFLRTSPLDLKQWLITIMLGFTGLFVGIAMRFIPVEEDPNSFSDDGTTFCAPGNNIKGVDDINPTVSKPLELSKIA